MLIQFFCENRIETNLLQKYVFSVDIKCNYQRTLKYIIIVTGAHLKPVKCLFYSLNIL